MMTPLLTLDQLMTHGLSLTREETLSLRNQYIPSACSLHFEKSPMKVGRASGQYLYDEVGTEFLDCVNCVAHVGHCHPEVVKAGIGAMSSIGYASSMGNPNLLLVDYISKLKTTFPIELDTCLFVASASEANDLAVQLARLYTGGTDVIAVERSFHGSLSLTTDISTRIYPHISSKHIPSWVHVIPCPDTYRGRHRDEDPKAILKYCEDARHVMEKAVKAGKKLCCFIGEPIMTAAGMIVPPTEWTKSVYKDIRSMGGLVIADEAQSGLGRCGEAWWAFQTQGVVPDIITIGKPLGNGHPMAVVVTRSQIACSLGEERLRSFAGDTVTAAIGAAVINTIRKENLQQNARNVGSFLAEGLRALITQHPNIGTVRGIGLMIGVEIVYNQESRKPARDLAERICYMMKENHVIVGNDGFYKNVLIFIPPMCFTCENAHRVIIILHKVLTKIEAEDNLEGTEEATFIINYGNHCPPNGGPSTNRIGTATPTTLSRNSLISHEMIFDDDPMVRPEYTITYEDLNLDIDTHRATSQYEEMD